MKKNIFRIGDYIEIINPKFVKRVGYPLYHKDLYESIEKNKEILDILSVLQLKPEHEDVGIFKTEIVVPRELVHAIAYIRVRQNRYGGNVRSIHYIDDFISIPTDKIYQITGKKVVKTGTRFASSGSYDRNGEYDYEPGGLEDCKTHILVQIMHEFKTLWIETCNIKKIC